MDDPFGPALLIAVVFIMAAVLRIVAAALPFIDDADTLRKEAENDSAKAKRALRLSERLEGDPFGELHIVYSCLLLIGSFVTGIAYLEPLKRQTQLADPLSAIVLLFLYALAAMLLTGVIPGNLAAHAQKMLFDSVSGLAEFILLLFRPFSAFCLWAGKLLLQPFHINPANANEHVTEEEIRMMVDIGEEKGAIESDEKEMIENIFEFNNMDAEDCMIHRKDITAIDIDDSEDEVLATIRDSGLSRFPVYEDTIDNVIGLLTTRDYLLNRASDAPKPLRALLRPAFFVPESVRTDVLFHEMQSRKQHMSIVVDEYGGTSGLITLEDLLEEIVGNIYDEFDPKEEQPITLLSDGRYKVSGAAELETLSETLNIELPEDEEYDTLGGLIFSRLTEIPADGERPVVECFGLKISVEEIADRRVEWAIVEKLPEEASE